MRRKSIVCLASINCQNTPSNPIALVEAPKTALYASLYFGMPQCKSDFLWLAVLNKSSLSYGKLKVLNGRKVLLFPELKDKLKNAGHLKCHYYNKQQLLLILEHFCISLEELG